VRTKKPKTLETTILALELLRRIPRGRKVNSRELREELLAQGFERDERSIQRLLKTLSDQFSIDRDERSIPYGYEWKEKSAGFILPSLSKQESLMLMLAEQHLRPLLPPAVMKAMNGFFEQARTNLAPHQDANLEKQWLKKVRVVSETQPLLPPQIRKGVLEQTSQALYNNQWLELDYSNAIDERKQHRVMPLGLAQQGPRLYLVCRFEGYDNERSLALHRIHTATASTLTFERPTFDLAKYDADGRFAISNGERVRLSFSIDKGPGKHLLESCLSEDQVVVERHDSYEITATVNQSVLLDRWLNSFGSQIREIKKTAVN
jgi:predicted DNA-binding transcriptional regulator YafY